MCCVNLLYEFAALTPDVYFEQWPMVPHFLLWGGTSLQGVLLGEGVPPNLKQDLFDSLPDKGWNIAFELLVLIFLSILSHVLGLGGIHASSLLAFILALVVHNFYLMQCVKVVQGFFIGSHISTLLPIFKVDSVSSGFWTIRLLALVFLLLARFHY